MEATKEIDNKNRTYYFYNDIIDLEVTATGLEPRTTQLLNEHSTIWPTKWFWVRVQLQSILNISTKRISVVKFSVLAHQMCALDTETLIISYSFSLEETS